MNTGATFDYYYGDEGNQFSFCRLPRQLITENTFKRLSTDAKLLYALMLERMGLSARNGWHDELGRIYIYFTVSEIRQTLNCGNDKAIKLLAELDTAKGIGLIERVKQGQGKPTKIFVKNFSRLTKPQNDAPDSTAEADSAENRTLDCDFSVALTAVFPHSWPRLFRSLDIGKAECNYIDMNYTYLSYINPSIYQERRPIQRPHPGWMDWIDKRGIETSQKQALYEQTISKHGSNGVQLSCWPRDGRQRRRRRRCHSKYGILTAKFHLLGAPPLIPLHPETCPGLGQVLSLTKRENSPAVGVFPLPTKRNSPSVPRQGRASACAAAREPASLRTGRALTGPPVEFGGG